MAGVGANNSDFCAQKTEGEIAVAKGLDKSGITEEEAREHELLYPLLRAVLHELRELSRKKQDEPLNKLKIAMANKLLSRVKTLLADEPTSAFLELLDEATLPTNSDAVIILAQYVSAMDQFKNKYQGRDYGGGPERWLTKENPRV